MCIGSKSVLFTCNSKRSHVPRLFSAMDECRMYYSWYSSVASRSVIELFFGNCYITKKLVWLNFKPRLRVPRICLASLENIWRESLQKFRYFNSNTYNSNKTKIPIACIERTVGCKISNKVTSRRTCRAVPVSIWYHHITHEHFSFPKLQSKIWLVKKYRNKNKKHLLRSKDDSQMR